MLVRSLLGCWYVQARSFMITSQQALLLRLNIQIPSMHAAIAILRGTGVCAFSSYRLYANACDLHRCLRLDLSWTRTLHAQHDRTLQVLSRRSRVLVALSCCVISNKIFRTISSGSVSSGCEVGGTATAGAAGWGKSKHSLRRGHHVARFAMHSSASGLKRGVES